MSATVAPPRPGRTPDASTPSRLPARATMLQSGERSGPVGAINSRRDMAPNGVARSDDARSGGSRSDSRRSASSSNFPKRQSRPEHAERVEHPILFQQFFKSVGPRTYAVQVKEATNGNHYIVFTEGRRDDKSGEVRKTRINIFSEDFDAFFDLLRQAAQYVKSHPLPPEFVAKRKKLWASIARKKSKGGPGASRGGRSESAVAASNTSTPAQDRHDQRPPDRRPATSQESAVLSRTTGGVLGRPEGRADDRKGERNEPPASPSRGRTVRPLPSARAAAGT